MKEPLFLPIRLLLALLEHGRRGVLMVLAQDEARVPSFSSNGPMPHITPAGYWQRITALCLGLTGAMWLLFFAVYFHCQPTQQPSLQLSCQMQVTSSMHESSMPIPLNLDRLETHMAQAELWYGYPLSGDVHLLVHIDARGQYRSHRLVKSDHWHLQQVVERYVRHISCLPAHEDGRAVSTWIPVHVHFEPMLP